MALVTSSAQVLYDLFETIMMVVKLLLVFFFNIKIQEGNSKVFQTIVFNYIEKQK